MGPGGSSRWPEQKGTPHATLAGHDTVGLEEDDLVAFQGIAEAQPGAHGVSGGVGGGVGGVIDWGFDDSQLLVQFGAEGLKGVDAVAPEDHVDGRLVLAQARDCGFEGAHVGGGEDGAAFFSAKGEVPVEAFNGLNVLEHFLGAAEAVAPHVADEAEKVSERNLGNPLAVFGRGLFAQDPVDVGEQGEARVWRERPSAQTKKGVTSGTSHGTCELFQESSQNQKRPARARMEWNGEAATALGASACGACEGAAGGREGDPGRSERAWPGERWTDGGGTSVVTSYPLAWGRPPPGGGRWSFPAGSRARHLCQ